MSCSTLYMSLRWWDSAYHLLVLIRLFLIIYLMVYNWGEMSCMTSEPFSRDLLMRSHNWLKVVIVTLHPVRVTSPTHDDTRAYWFVFNCGRDTPCNLEFCHRIRCGQVFFVHDAQMYLHKNWKLKDFICSQYVQLLCVCGTCQYIWLWKDQKC